MQPGKLVIYVSNYWTIYQMFANLSSNWFLIIFFVTYNFTSSFWMMFKIDRAQENDFGW